MSTDKDWVIRKPCKEPEKADEYTYVCSVDGVVTLFGTWEEAEVVRKHKDNASAAEVVSLHQAQGDDPKVNELIRSQLTRSMAKEFENILAKHLNKDNVDPSHTENIYVKMFEDFLQGQAKEESTEKIEWCIARYGPLESDDEAQWSVWTERDDFQLIVDKDLADELCQRFENEEDDFTFKAISIDEAVALLNDQPSYEEWDESKPYWSIDDLLNELSGD